MKRLALLVVALACAALVLVLGTGASQSSSPYKVRAIFDSAFSVIAGEDVKVAGVKVGKIEKLAVTPDNKAAIVLDIEQPAFGDFRADASCRIRPQSLIGEKFVECTPTQPRAPGFAPPPPLKVIPKGHPGAGEHLLPIQNTQRTIDLDLINNILRLPFRQRLSIILNELGTGLAGNGQALNQAIRRADPALLETDKVIRILAEQNRVLRDLAVNGDRVLAPLAQRRHQVADFVVKAGDVSQATAERDRDLERTFQRLPRFLSELRPTMVRLGAFADQATPVTQDLGAEAPALSRFARALGPFSRAGIPGIRSLGHAAEVGKVAVPKTLPITRDIRALASQARPLAGNLKATLDSLRDTGGIERLMDYLFFQAAAVNGFDSVGHYLRAELIVNTCSGYATTPQQGCLARFDNGGGSARARAAKSTGDPALDRMNRILARIAAGQKPAAAARAVLGARSKSAARRHRHSRRHAARHHRRAKRHHRRAGHHDNQQSAPPSGQSAPPSGTPAKPPLQLPQSVLPGAPAGSAPPSPSGTQQQQNDPTAPLLDYLLGGGP